MNTNMFTRGPSLPNRLAMAILLSVVLIFVDHKLDGFSTVRVVLNSLVSPIQYLASLPGQIVTSSVTRLVSYQQLQAENTELKKLAAINSEKLQRFATLQKENDRLRELLGSPIRQDAEIMIAELIEVDNNPFSHQVVIDKGALQGVYQGQSVLDDKGIVGQILEVGTSTSRVLLIADVTHGIPLRVARNNVRLIARGSGQLNELFIEHVAQSADIEVGDTLLSSGLGKVFPEGYPVAQISSIVLDEGRPFAQVSARPIAQLDRLKYMLLLWPQDAPQRPVYVEE